MVCGISSSNMEYRISVHTNGWADASDDVMLIERFEPIADAQACMLRRRVGSDLRNARQTGRWSAFHGEHANCCDDHNEEARTWPDESDDGTVEERAITRENAIRANLHPSASTPPRAEKQCDRYEDGRGDHCSRSQGSPERLGKHVRATRSELQVFLSSSKHRLAPSICLPEAERSPRLATPGALTR